jgi:hypothetical protein
MTKYRKILADKSPCNDTPVVRAVINLINAVEKNISLDSKSMETLSEAYLEFFGRAHLNNGVKVNYPKSPIDIVKNNGRPLDYGFTRADIIKARFELFRRDFIVNYSEKKALSLSKEATIKAFNMSDDPNSMRSLNKDLKNSDLLKYAITNEDLEKIIAPYVIGAK